MEHRIQQLELKLAEQEQVNAGLRDDIKSLKEQKKKKFAGVLEEVNKSMSALQDQQGLLATEEELQYATQIMLLLSDQANIR